VRLALLALLVGVAIAYFTAPTLAAEECRRWSAEMLEDEGGPVLTAFVCSDDPGQSTLALTCGGGTVWLSLDLAKDGERVPELEETAVVEFVTDAGIESLSMQHQAMDGMFAASTPVDGALVKKLSAEQGLLVRDTAAAYPAKTFSLAGSAESLRTLAADCR
jgi:hypothetical protein